MITPKDRAELPDLGTFVGTPEELARHMEDLALHAGETISSLQAELNEDEKKLAEAEAAAQKAEDDLAELKRQQVQDKKALNRKLNLPEDLNW